jgi:hypothetical protein
LNTMPEAPQVVHPVPASSGVLVWEVLSSFFCIFMVVDHMFLAVHLLETVVWNFLELQQQISYDCNCPLRNIQMPSNSHLCRSQERYSSFLAQCRGQLRHQGLLWTVCYIRQRVLRDPLKIREKTQIAKYWRVVLHGVQMSQTFPGSLAEDSAMHRT